MFSHNATMNSYLHDEWVVHKIVYRNDNMAFFQQKCHEPRISDQDANDLRLVWYCHQCTRKMREMSTSSVPKTKNTESLSNNRSSFTGAALKPPKLQSFQRLSTSDSKVCYNCIPVSHMFRTRGLQFDPQDLCICSKLSQLSFSFRGFSMEANQPGKKA